MSVCQDNLTNAMTCRVASPSSARRTATPTQRLHPCDPWRRNPVNPV